MTDNLKQLPKAEKKSLQNATEKPMFKPSANQEKWLATAIQSEHDEVSKIAEECGIDRAQWYRWLKEPDFIEWFKAEWNKAIQGQAWKLDVWGMKQARRDFNYWKEMQKRVGNITDEKAPSALIQQNFYEKAISDDRNKYQ
jgi:hypothetical protein